MSRMFLSKSGVALLAACVLSSPAVAAQHQGGGEALWYIQQGRGPEFAFKMRSVPIIADVLGAARAAEIQTGVNLGFKSDSGKRSPISAEQLSLDAGALLGMPAPNAVEVIHNFSLSLVCVYSALNELATTGLRTHPIDSYPLLKSLYQRVLGEGLVACKDFLRNASVSFDQLKQPSSDGILREAAEAFNNLLRCSVSRNPDDVQAFLQAAERDCGFNDALRK
ncbi:MAG: hypothetical protein LBQ43_05050 [Holosporales bacterium]|jgi:hypothetical protein|nr:hypothetical protein [Holosporales bacterium]